jgi:hypothetical protein
MPKCVCRSPTVLLTHRSDFGGTGAHGLIEHRAASPTTSSALLVVPPMARGLSACSHSTTLGDRSTTVITHGTFDETVRPLPTQLVQTPAYRSHRSYREEVGLVGMSAPSHGFASAVVALSGGSPIRFHSAMRSRIAWVSQFSQTPRSQPKTSTARSNIARMLKMAPHHLLIKLLRARGQTRSV